MSMKNPMTPAGIEPATFRFVAQHLNHCAIAVPRTTTIIGQIILTKMLRYRLTNIGLNEVTLLCGVLDKPSL